MLTWDWEFVRYIFTDLIGFCYFVLPVLLTFGVQLTLCFRVKRAASKLIPLLAAIGVIAGTLLLGLLTELGMILLFPLGIGGLLLLGSTLAWLVYGGIRGVSSVLSSK